LLIFQVRFYFKLEPNSISHLIHWFFVRCEAYSGAFLCLWHFLSVPSLSVFMQLSLPAVLLIASGFVTC
jgi:hypothetical protein